MKSQRHRAREAALQALYLWELGRTEPAQALDTFFAEHMADAPEAVRGFARELVLGTTSDLTAIDPIVQQHIEHWRLERLAVIDRLILRLAVWELRHETGTPGPVIVNEALELARTFSTDESVRFVNGVLDGIRRTIAPER
jgi:N utilization substance protein B